MRPLASGSGDVLVWKPTDATHPTWATLADNWYDQTKDQQGVMSPTSSNPIILDGNTANKPIEIPANFQTLAVNSITVQGNYNNTFTFNLNAGISINANSTIQSGSILTLVSGDIELDNGANFTVSSEGTLNLKDPAGSTTGSNFMTAPDGIQGEYLNNAGTVNWYGIAAAAGKEAIVDQLSVPVLNTGKFNADGGSGGDTTMVGGQLWVRSTDPATDNYSFYQTSGSLNLKNNAQLKCELGYEQEGGSLTSDATPCTLIGGDGTGKIHLEGGNVAVDTVANTISTLTLQASDVLINCEIDLNGLTTGGKSTRSDQLICQGADVSLIAGSFLNVGTTGTAALGTGNQWTVMTYTSIAGTWGQTKVPLSMAASTGPKLVLVSN